MLKADMLKKLVEDAASEDSDNLIDIESEGEEQGDSPYRPVKPKPKESPDKIQVSLNKI